MRESLREISERKRERMSKGNKQALLAISMRQSRKTEGEDGEQEKKEEKKIEKET